MKIATWNLMRPNEGTITRNTTFGDALSNCNADIIVLTETNSIITFEGYASVQTKELPPHFEGFTYVAGENRATIFSRYPFGKSYDTCDPYTAVCNEIITPAGPMLLYATIFGVTGGRDQRFRQDFDMQKGDIKKLAEVHDVCVVGDFNITFTGYAYPSDAVKNEATDFFDANNMEILTTTIGGSAEHIAVSRKFINNAAVGKPVLISCDKKTSDHGLVWVELDWEGK